MARGNIVADTVQHTWRFKECIGPVAIEIPADGRYTIVLTPEPSYQRGSIVSGGRICPSSQWQAGEVIEVVNAHGQTVYVKKAHPPRTTGTWTPSQEAVALQAGTYTVVPNFLTAYSAFVAMTGSD